MVWREKNKQVTWTKNQEWGGGAILNRMVPLGLIERVKLEQRLQRGEEYLQGEGGDSTKAIGACQSGWSCQGSEWWGKLVREVTGESDLLHPHGPLWVLWLLLWEEWISLEDSELRHDISNLPLSCSNLAFVLRLDCGETAGLEDFAKRCRPGW